MSDYSTLAQRVCSSISGIRGCLMLSRDGMVLGAHPEGEAEAHLKTAWVRFASLGDPDRSYVEYPDQTWGFVRRGGYAAFSVADAGIRPGVLVDLLEQVLMTGEQERADDRSALRLPEAPSAPSGKPRTSLHKPERIATPPSETSTVAPTIETRGSRRIADRDDAPASDAPPDGVEAVPIDASEVAAQSARAAPAKPAGAGEEESEVDRILLAKEFAGLLQVPKDDDEASR